MMLIANYPYAHVSIDGNPGNRGSDIKTIEMGAEDSKLIKIAITSVDETVTKVYIVNIVKPQDEFSLKAVYLNNRIAKKVSDTVYEIDVQKGTDKVDLKAVSAFEDSYV